MATGYRVRCQTVIMPSLGPCLSKVRGTIEQYELLPHGEVSVACSGGKDSTLLCLVLRELGYSVIPVIVDMHYRQDWATSVSDNLAALGFRPVTLELDTPASHAPDSRLLLSLTVLRSAPDDRRFTPCTGCYNSKVLVLDKFLQDHGLDRIAFGHHATDAAASLVKSALMYRDRWDQGHATYDPVRFRLLARELKASLTESMTSADLARIQQLVEAGCAGTDEPPRQPLVPDGARVIVRPLSAVWEEEILALAADLGPVEDSGCGHTASQSSQTPREIVQYEVIRPLEQFKSTRHALEKLIWLSLAPDGSVQYNVRRDRERLLGPDYKPGFGLSKL